MVGVVIVIVSAGTLTPAAQLLIGTGVAHFLGTFATYANNGYKDWDRASNYIGLNSPTININTGWGDSKDRPNGINQNAPVVNPNSDTVGNNAGNNGNSGTPGGGESADYLLANLYWHNQFGGGTTYNINASTLDFSGTSQRELGLSGMKPGDFRFPNLFNSGINSNSLALGNLRITYMGNNQFSISSNRFDFDYISTASFGRNAGTFVGGAVFGQFYTIPITPFSILRNTTGFGGIFMINFNGTVTIPK